MVVKDRPRFRHALRELAENSSIHGLPKIVGSKQNYMKVIWTLVFIATTGYLTFQLTKLFQSYFSFPVKTAVTLKYNPLRFPAVSFCNMNPIKRSYINFASDEVRSILNPEWVKRTEMAENETQEDDYFLGNITSPSNDTDYLDNHFENNTDIVENADSGNSYTDYNSNYDSDDYGNANPADYGNANPADYGNANPADYGNANPADYGNANPADYANVNPGDYGNANPADYGNTNPADYGNANPPDYGNTNPADYGNANPADYGDANPPDYGGSYVDSYNSYGDFYSSFYDDITNQFPNIDAKLIRELLAFDDTDAPREQWITRVEDFKQAFMNELRERREVMGHSIHDMLVSCSYNARKCFSKDFKLFQSSEYGNCFTLESSKYFSRKPGPLNGLWLTLNLEVLEYITSFVIGYGVKLLIHQPGTVVFPTVEGIVLSPGHETTIALRMVNVKRLGPPYGDCTNGEEFQKTFGIQYTIPACIQLCKHHWVVKMCQCVPGQLDVQVGANIDNDAHFYNLPLCDIDTRADRSCQLKVESLYIKGSLECSCGSPCEEILYEKTISGRPWPNDDFLKNELVKNMCSNESMTYSKDFCDRFLKPTDSANITAARNNFLRVVIYYEDINYEVITETPLYDSFFYMAGVVDEAEDAYFSGPSGLILHEFQFLSNIGGTVGLFLGASVLSAVEIIHLFIEIAIYLRRRIRHKKISDGIKIVKVNVKPLPKKEKEEAKNRF